MAINGVQSGSSSSNQVKGFTLIELLVVIAIISILAAILFPVFSQAKESAKSSACLSNVKQLTLGVVLYAGDCDDGLPPTQNGSQVLWPDLINQYIRSSKLRVCPDDNVAINSYGLNELVFIDFTDYLPGLPPTIPTMGTVANVASTIMLGELGTQDDLKSPRENGYKLCAPDASMNDGYDARPAARHFSRCNLGFFDGHAGGRQLNRFYVGQLPADLWFCADSQDAIHCVSGQ